MSERMTMQMVTASVLGALLVFTVSFAEEEKTVGQEVVVFDEASNKEIKYCDSTMTESCDCRKGLSDNPENAVPANECVLLNIGLGRARHSALTESITLQLNELSPNSLLYSPSGFKVVAGYAVYGVSREKNTSNVPRHVQITDPSGVITRFLFADGESVAAPFAAIGNRTDGRLAMVDAEGWATAADPAYYDFYPGDGSLWRFGASPASAEYLRFVFHQTAQGRVETPQDMGVEIIRDADGVLRQVMTPAWLADFAVTGQDGYDLRLYPHDASCVPGTRSADGVYVIAQGAAPDAVWEFRNPQPGVPRELSVTRKRGDVSETWLYRYEEAVQDFTLVYPQGVMVKRLERVYSDDRKSWTLKRTLTASDGNVVRTEQKHFVAGASGSLLMESVRDPDGLNLVKRYDYYQDSVLNRLLKAAVNEDGAWSRYEYDGQRRKTAEIRPWLDSPTNAPNNQCSVTRYGYGLFAAGDFLAYNDQRPRTEIKEICGIEVARTYHAYPTNALGQTQEIEERAAFPGAPYGHVSNPRTVKTYYAASAALPLPGRLATVVYPGGKVESYGYEYGTYNAATFAFAADPDGGAWRETVTTSYGANSGVQALRSARVWDEKGHEVLNESYVEDGAAFALIGWTRMSYDSNGKLVETAYSDGRVVSATWGANCCGKESETTAEGIITVYGYNALKQKVSETKKGLAADGSDDITTLYTYDLENHVISSAVTNIASGLGYVVSRNAYDAVGRAINTIDRLGNPTVTIYDALATSVHRPNGVTTVTERYLDGKIKRVLENGVVKQSYAYGVSPDGTRWTLSAAGHLPSIAPLTAVADLLPLTSGLDFPWQFQAADPLGRTVATSKPGFGHTVLVTSNIYDTAGSIIRTERRVSGVESRLLDATLYAYDAAGNRVLTALDLNTNGVIDLSGPDRITGSSSAYEKDAANTWWSVSRSRAYPEFNSSAAVTTLVQRIQLSGLGVQQGDDSVRISHAERLDVRGNATVAEVLVGRMVRKVSQVTTLLTSAQPTIQTSVNGLKHLTVSSTGVTNTFGYDALGRETTVIDGRGNTSITAYNILGQVAYTEDAASSRTSYDYDFLGRRTKITDALGNVTQTAYDQDGRVIATWGATYPVRYCYDDLGHIIAMRTYRSIGVLGLPPADDGDLTQWKYDNPTGLLTNKLYADCHGPSYTYTPDGKLASRLWARGILTSYAYDMAGFLSDVIYSDSTPSIVSAYDRLGHLISAMNSVSTNVYSYSSGTLDLTSETQNGEALIRLADAKGHISKLSLGCNYEVVYGYDGLGRFESISSTVGRVSSVFGYSRLLGTDIVSGYAAAHLSVARTFEPQRDVIARVRNESTAGIISQFDYANDANGRRISRIETGLAFEQHQTNSFSYNQRSEVTSANLHTNTYDYVYDAVGNRLISSHNAETIIYVVNALNQYSSVSALSEPQRVPAYDLDGNMIYDGKEWFYVWNGENRLALASNATFVVRYAYDYSGRVVGKGIEQIGAAVQDFKEDKNVAYIWDGYNIVAEYIVTNGIKATTYNVWGVDMSGTFQDAGGVGGLLAVIKGSSSFFPLYDANGNVTEYISFGGDVVAHREYSAFGETTALSGDFGDSFTFGWSTKPWSSHAGLSEYEFRKFSPLFGRWLNRDPLDEVGFGFQLRHSLLMHNRNILNLYFIPQNNLVSQTDFLGLSAGNWLGRVGCQEDKENQTCTQIPVIDDKINDPKYGQDVIACVREHENCHIDQCKNESSCQFCVWNKEKCACQRADDYLKPTDLTGASKEDYECSCYLTEFYCLNSRKKGKAPDEIGRIHWRMLAIACMMENEIGGCGGAVVPDLPNGYKLTPELCAKAIQYYRDFR